MKNKLDSLMVIGKITHFLGTLLLFNFFFGLILFGFFRWLLFGSVLLFLLFLSLLAGKTVIFKPGKPQAESQSEQPHYHRRNKTNSDIIDVEAEVVDE
ncbi:MAG: hypothetical protein GY853_02930 [PVC group bacterium]|nr:hypothetical protein [PVC group bacterium]